MTTNESRLHTNFTLFSGRWTDDPILKEYRFCSVFRVADAGSQFLITEVIEKGSQVLEDVVFRVLLYNFFTRIATYEELERKLGPLTWKRFNCDAFAKVLADFKSSGEKLYTPAFQKFAPRLGASTGWENHLRLLELMMTEVPNIVHVVQDCKHLVDAYDWISRLPQMGEFTAHQLMLDLSYAPGLARFHPSDFVIAGVGAVYGIEKCFNGNSKGIEVEIMRWMFEHQDEMFARLGLKFEGFKVKGKTVGMQLCDVEHTLCEVHKYEAMKRRTSVSGGRARRFVALNKLDKEPILPKAWNNRSRLVPRVKKGKHTRADKLYVVNRILERRRVAGDGGKKPGPPKYEYLVDWLGYDVKDRSWEPEDMLREDAPVVLEEFEKERKKNQTRLLSGCNSKR